jgi:hypothetical protein
MTLSSNFPSSPSTYLACSLESSWRQHSQRHLLHLFKMCSRSRCNCSKQLVSAIKILAAGHHCFTFTSFVELRCSNSSSHQEKCVGSFGQPNEKSQGSIARDRNESFLSLGLPTTYLLTLSKVGTHTAILGAPRLTCLALRLSSSHEVTKPTCRNASPRDKRKPRKCLPRPRPTCYQRNSLQQRLP